jgi:hypothetical protein
VLRCLGPTGQDGLTDCLAYTEFYSTAQLSSALHFISP